MCKTLCELRTALQLFHCSVLKICTLSLWSIRVGSMENCCLFAEIFNILYQQRCWTSHLKQKETAETMTNFRAVNGLLNSLLPFLEIASASLRSEYSTYVSASVWRSLMRQSYLRSLFSSWCFWYCNFLWYLPASTSCSYLPGSYNKTVVIKSLLLLYVLHFRVEPDPSKAVNLNVTFDSNAPCVVGELLPSKWDH